MTIKVGDRVPDGTLTEFIETETAGCSLGPNAFQVADLVRGKKIALFAVPGAADLLGQAPAGLCRAGRRAQGQGRGRDLVRVGQRRLRHGRLGP